MKQLSQTTENWRIILVLLFMKKRKVKKNTPSKFGITILKKNVDLDHVKKRK